MMKYKTKVSYQANPNGNLWMKGEDGFGQKMLAKMGWTEGKGLGKNNQGITKAITVSKKSDNRGVGCSKQWAEEGNAQMDAFADVLASLNSQNASPASEDTGTENEAERTVGLEETSRNSKFRLHYSKFTRGKDLSRYSETALKCIVGSRGISSKRKMETAEASSDGKETRDDSVRYISSVVNMADYFRQKMEAKKNSLKSSSSAPQLHGCDEASSDDESMARPSFGGGGNSFMPTNSFADHFQPTFFLGGNSQTSTDRPAGVDDAEEGIPSRPSFFIGDTSEKGVEGSSGCDDGPAPDDPSETGKRKKKSKKRKREDQEEVDCDSTSGKMKRSEESVSPEPFPPSFQVGDVIEGSSDPEVADTMKRRKKKSKKRKREDRDGESCDLSSRKEKRSEEESVNPEPSHPSLEVVDATAGEGAFPDAEAADSSRSKKKKRKKRNREDQDGESCDFESGKKERSEEESASPEPVRPSFEVGDAVEEEVSPDAEAADATKSKKKKNKKRNRDEVKEEHPDAQSSKSRKKSKKEKRRKLEDQSETTSDFGKEEGEVERSELCEEGSGTSGNKVAKKKRASKHRGAERPAEDLKKDDTSPRTELRGIAPQSSRTKPLTTSEQISMLENKSVLQSLDPTVFSTTNLDSVIGYKYYGYKPSYS